jgi:hypothetical protein
MSMPSALTSDKRREFKGVVSNTNKDFSSTIRRFDDTDGLNV